MADPTSNSSSLGSQVGIPLINNMSASSQVQVVQPQNQLVSIGLNETNYLIWRQQVLTAVKGYGLEGYLSGNMSTPAQFTVDEQTQQQVLNPEFVIFQRQDQLLASWLLSSLSESILVMMVGLNTAHEMWETLEINFSSQSRARLMQYRLQLQTLKKGSFLMREYLNKIKLCCDTLASAGQKLSEEDQILHILSGLGSEYNPVMVSITSRAEPYSLKDVSALLLSFETRLETISEVSEDSVTPTANIVVQGQQRRDSLTNKLSDYSQVQCHILRVLIKLS